MIRITRSLVVAVLALLSANSASLIAQAPARVTPLVAPGGGSWRAPGDSAFRRPVVSDTPQTLFSRRDAYLAAGFAVITVAMFPADRRLARLLRDSSLLANRYLSDASKGLEYITDPGAFAIGASLYTIGRIGKWRDMADLGLHGTEGVLLATTVTMVLKGVLGRARPYVSADTNPANFSLGRGFDDRDFKSFPSGHTTAAFAAAAAVTSESRRWWPNSTPIVATVMYGGATLVGLARIYHDQHWASDIALGAAVGTFGGLKVVRYSHNHPHNFVDRVLLPMTFGFTPRGDPALVWSW